MTAPTAPVPDWPPAPLQGKVTFSHHRMAFSCISCLDPHDGEYHRSCEHVSKYFRNCGDLDDAKSAAFVARYAIINRPRVMWFPLAIGVDMVCTIQKVPLSELGPVGWANREPGVSQITWPVTKSSALPELHPDGEWMYEVRDLRAVLGLRRRGSLSHKDLPEIVRLRAGAQSSTPVLIDPEDSFLKFIRIQRDIYSSALHYYEGLEKIINKRLPPCTAPESQHKAAGTQLRDDIKEVAQRLHGPNGLEMYNAWRRSQLPLGNSGPFLDVLREIAMGYSYSMVTDQVCLQCAKLAEPIPDFAVPRL